MKTVRVGILGFGPVGRTAARLLNGAEGYEVTVVTEADELSGTPVSDRWNLREGAWAKLYSRPAAPCPENVAGLKFSRTSLESLKGNVDAVVSALPDAVAAKVEFPLAMQGIAVSSHSEYNRWNPQARLVNPAVNFHDIEKAALPSALPFVVTPNCTIPLFVPILAYLINRDFSVGSVTVTTHQARSGKGDAALDPGYLASTAHAVFNDWKLSFSGLSGEEWATTAEPWRMLGQVASMVEAQSAYRRIAGGFSGRCTPIFAHTHRSQAEVGHAAVVTTEFNGLGRSIYAREIEDIILSHRMPAAASSLQFGTDRYFRQGAWGLDTRQLNSDNERSVLVGDFRQEGQRRISVRTAVNNLVAGAAGNALWCLEALMAIRSEATRRTMSYEAHPGTA
ncbi:hypothetical protein HYU16_04345 [Candidatus Woesearchaeota archaeon]|nr:hypothetical protein [Candidatus Woesearchaeota archaeon]